VYSSGELSRTYETEYQRAVGISTDTLRQLKIPPAEEIGDGLKTEIKATRPDGTPVTVEVERIESNLTQISVRTGAIGMLDKHVSTQIHEYIERNLVQRPEIGSVSAENKLAKLDAASQKRNIKEQSPVKPRGPERMAKSDAGTDMPVTEVPPPSTQDLEKQTRGKYIIFFHQDSNRLQEKALEKLGEIAAVIGENPDAQLMITGFSDSKGSPPYRKMLSEKRANTVKLFLVANGINPGRSRVIAQERAGDLPNQGALIEILH